MMRWLIVAVFAVAVLLLPGQHQRCEAEDHQSATTNVQQSSAPTAVISAVPRPTATSAQTDQSHNESWNYWDAIAPSTWNGWALAVVGGVAAFIALRTLSQIREQVKAENSSVEMMRTEYVATHRPRVRVRNLALDLSDMNISDAAKSSQIQITLHVVNYGESDALPTNAQYSVVLDKAVLPMVPEYRSEFVSKIGYEKLESGRGRTAIIIGQERGPLLRVFQGSTPLVVIGYVEYRSATGAGYRTAFARRYNQGRFHKMDDPDYEYEE